MHEAATDTAIINLWSINLTCRDSKYLNENCFNLYSTRILMILVCFLVFVIFIIVVIWEKNIYITKFCILEKILLYKRVFCSLLVMLHQIPDQKVKFYEFDTCSKWGKLIVLGFSVTSINSYRRQNFLSIHLTGVTKSQWNQTTSYSRINQSSPLLPRFLLECISH